MAFVDNWQLRGCGEGAVEVKIEDRESRWSMLFALPFCVGVDAAISEDSVIGDRWAGVSWVFGVWPWAACGVDNDMTVY
jgi:hypothetical protein